MFGEMVQTNRGVYVRCAPDSGVVANESDLLTLFSDCYEFATNRLLLSEAHLHPNFFDLSTGMAGALFLKLSIYHVKTAVVANLQAIKSQRFHELIQESNKGSQIRFFNTTTEAENWLLS